MIRAIWLTEGEHQALNLGSLALREVGAALTRSGAGDLAAVSYLSAAALESLVQRAFTQARAPTGRVRGGDVMDVELPHLCQEPLRGQLDSQSWRSNDDPTVRREAGGVSSPGH